MKRKLAATVLATVLACFLVGFPANSADAAPAKARNVIFMVPDGFSPAYAASYRLYKGELSAMDSMLAGMVRTYSANSALTDSAAAATAMATGHKTNNGMIGTTPDGKQRRTILEAAREQGKSTGLVASSSITDATPAAFSSHIASRDEESDIAPQQLEDADVLLGGGKTFFLPESLGANKSHAILWRKQGAAVTPSWRTALNCKPQAAASCSGCSRAGTWRPNLIGSIRMNPA
ncbi:hypothetical protein J6TS7_10940 [Paenibacillus dendritiformis]|nr:hypothetical protein J6TS7_10940 [Paenibacillus dendritiformis]